MNIDLKQDRLLSIEPSITIDISGVNTTDITSKIMCK